MVQQTRGPEFFMDGRPVNPDSLSIIRTGSQPRVGDVAFVDRFAIVLSGQERYDLVSSPDTKGTLRERLFGGKERVISVWVGRVDVESETDCGSENDAELEEVFVNPLEALSDSEIGALRGVTLTLWEDALRPQIDRLPLGDTCIWVQLYKGVGEPKGLPPLPRSLSYLRFDAMSSDGFEDLSRLADFDKLRFLRLRPLGSDAPVDLDWLRNAPQLRYFGLSGGKLLHSELLQEFTGLHGLDLSGCNEVDEGPDCLSQLRDLRLLSLNHCANLRTIEFLRGMKKLEEFHIVGTQVQDLTPIEEVATLRFVNANTSTVTKLPERLGTGLRKLSVMSTPLVADVVDRLRETSPQCIIDFGWSGKLTRHLLDVDRVRVRSGGTCHRDEASEETLCVEQDPVAVSELVRSFAVEEARSGGHCMCCGEPTIEFYRDENLVAAVGLHHGVSARWREWPGDAVLTNASRDRISDWLRGRGVERFTKELDESRQHEDAVERLWASYAIFVSPALLTLAREEQDDDDAFLGQVKLEMNEGAARAELGFRLLGCGRGSWNHRYIPGLQHEGLELLRDATPEDRGSALARAGEVMFVDEGAARWFFYHGEFDSIPEAILFENIEAITELALTHSRAFNRRHTLTVLEQIEGDFSIYMLRRVLEGMKARELDPVEAVEPPGQVVFQGGQSPLPEDCSDRSVAALILARRGDHGSLPMMRTLLRQEVGESRSLVEQAIETLEGTRTRRRVWSRIREAIRHRRQS
jgi:hypothetical protein